MSRLPPGGLVRRECQVRRRAFGPLTLLESARRTHLMTHDDIHAFFERQGDHWRERDPAGLSAGYAADATIVSPIFRTVSGRPAILRSFESLFEIFPDWDLRPERLLIDGRSVAEPFTVTATHVGEFMGLRGCGRRFEIQGVRLFDMDDGLISRERRYYDFTGLLIQIGVLKGKPVV